MKKTRSKKSTEAMKLLKELRESIAKKPNPFSGMTKEQVIKHTRKVREKLWEKKLASRH